MATPTATPGSAGAGPTRKTLFRKSGGGELESCSSFETFSTPALGRLPLTYCTVHVLRRIAGARPQ